MTYLSVEEVAQTSVLSKRWNQLRISFPIFDFDKSDFDPYYFVGKGFALHKFLNFVDTSLVQFSKFDLSMLKFRLFISILHVKESAPYIDKWVELATEKEVKEFDLKFLVDADYSVPNTIYTLPQTIFSARSLTTLRLVGYGAEAFCECPLLEELFLWHCWGLKRFCVSKALKLKILTIKSYEFESVEIVVPDLQELALEFDPYNSPRAIDIIGGSKLKKLKLVGTDLKEQDFHHFISKFPLLEDLTFINCYLLERITISCN
ncbi:hypothetical protein Pint_29769 [Pistacia integerrima]|uniref:Uncharacterized protein n=1 Tax=Pistacia integerrima TaxID=434235 RepID=A0ACC0X111_9ROSI|nr:hypothetical protein Pint_29769 [Pistacia integerrima]